MEQNPSCIHHKTTVDNRRWFSLPDEILENIASRIDIPECPIFSFSATTFKIRIFNNIPGLWTILDNLFTIFCSPSVTNFDLLLPYTVYKEPCSSTILNSWIRHLRAHNVRHLCLSFYSGGTLRQLLYPQIIFHIHSLVSLNIDSCISNEITMTFCNSITLPKLKVLKLGNVNCYQSLKGILRVCPSLESLRLTIEDEQPQTGGNGLVLITGKNLKVLDLSLSSRSIIEVTIDAPKLEDFHYHCNSFISMRMFESISHVKSLSIVVGCPIRLYNCPTKTIYPNLGHFTLYFSGAYDIIDAIFPMLHHCPNLEVLRLDYIDFKHMIQIPRAKFASIVEHVKQITLCMGHVRFNEDMSCGFKYLLRSAPVLEKLVINGIFIGSDSKSDKAQFHQTLLDCPKASPNCEIVEFLS